MTILFCISDHGFGHATRSIPIINALQEQIIVRNMSAAPILRRETNADIIEQRNDYGVHHDGLKTDMNATKEALRTWLDWEEDIERIRDVIREHDVSVILSDIAPHPFIAAEKEGTLGIFLGSFTWIDTYDHLEILTKGQKEKLEEAYGAADTGIIYPLDAKCEGIAHKQHVNLVARNPCGLVEPMTDSVFITTGGSLDSHFSVDFSGVPIVSSFSKKRYDREIRIDENIPAIEYVNAADVIIGKTGYGIVSESIRCRKPMILVKRDRFLDDEMIENVVKELKIGLVFEMDEMPSVTDELVAQAKELKKNYKELPEIYQEDGVREAVKIIEDRI